MRWFKHDTNARNDLKLKLLKKKFGMEGYGVYFSLLEIIGEYIDADNYHDWGFVEKLHTTESLAEDIGIDPNKLKGILLYCNEIGLFEKKNGRLYSEKIKARLDDYADRIKLKRTKSEDDANKVGTKSEQSAKSVQTKSDIDKNRTDKDKKRLDIGKSPEIENERDTRTSKPQLASIGDILANRIKKPEPSSSGISKEWQEKAFRDMEYVGVKLQSKDIGRVFKIYKEESLGNQHKASTQRVISYLKDYPGVLDYEGKLKMFFKLISNGLNSFQS